MQKNKAIPKGMTLIFGAGDGNFPAQRAYRLAIARCHVSENSTLYGFLPQCKHCSFLVRFPIKKNKAIPKGMTLFLEQVMGIEPT